MANPKSKPRRMVVTLTPLAHKSLLVLMEDLGKTPDATIEEALVSLFRTRIDKQIDDTRLEVAKTLRILPSYLRVVK